MSENKLQVFDAAVERYLSAEMSADEEAAFKKALDSSEELKRRAAFIAMVIKAAQELGAERDRRIIAQIKNMSKEEFLNVALRD